MTEVIIVALIGGLASIIGNYFIHLKSKRKDDATREYQHGRLDERLKRMEQKLDEHNHYAKKFEVVEKAIVRLETLMEKGRRK